MAFLFHTSENKITFYLLFISKDLPRIQCRSHDRLILLWLFRMVLGSCHLWGTECDLKVFNHILIQLSCEIGHHFSPELYLPWVGHPSHVGQKVVYSLLESRWQGLRLCEVLQYVVWNTAKGCISSETTWARKCMSTQQELQNLKNNLFKALHIRDNWLQKLIFIFIFKEMGTSRTSYWMVRETEKLKNVFLHFPPSFQIGLGYQVPKFQAVSGNLPDLTCLLFSSLAGEPPTSPQDC